MSSFVKNRNDITVCALFCRVSPYFGVFRRISACFGVFRRVSPYFAMFRRLLGVYTDRLKNELCIYSWLWEWLIVLRGVLLLLLRLYTTLNK